MPHPVPIPAGARPVTDAETARAEALVAAITQIFQYGTSGATTNTPRTDVPDGLSQALAPLVLSTAEQQLFYRQMAVALATSVANFASASVVGITRLSSDPGAPEFPTALNSEEVTIVPTSNLVPRARPDGTLDPAWISGGGPSASPVIGTFGGVCLASAAVGDLVYVSAAGKVVRLCDPSDGTKIPAVGCITSKPSSTSCVVQCHGLVSGVYSGLTPGNAYLVGADGRPTNVLPVLAPGQSFYLHPIGIAIDANLMLIQTVSNVTLRRG